MKRNFMKKYHAVSLLTCLALSGCLLLAACSSAPYTKRNQFILMDSTQELSLGEQAAKEVLAAEKIERNAANAARVSRIRITTRSASSGSMERRPTEK